MLRLLRPSGRCARSKVRRQGGSAPKGPLPPGNLVPSKKAVGSSLKSRREMAQFDQLSPFQRCLVSFYGAAKINRAPQRNHEDLPAVLGRAEEFWREWEVWKAIANNSADSSVNEEHRVASKAALLGIFR